MRRTPAWSDVGSGPLSDPVEAVLDAHRRGEPLRLSTSGSTGTPRVVVRSSESWWCSFDAYSELSGVTAGARVWVPGPTAGTMNLFAAVHARVVGASLVARDAATHACVTPSVLARGGLVSGLHATVAGGPLTARAAERAEADGLRVVHYYGAAELSFVAAGRDADSLRAFPGVEIDVRDEVIWVRSPYLAEDQGPWASVGDLGAYDGDRLVVRGRPDAVTTAGVTVLLSDVERALGDQVVCFGVPHPELGEVLCAAVVGDPVDVRRRAASLPAASRPRRWLELEQLPLTPAGKPDRPALRRLISTRHAR